MTEIKRICKNLHTERNLREKYTLSHFNNPHELSQCGPTFCDSWANMCNAASMAGRKQSTKIIEMVKTKCNTFNWKIT
jgi:hypothetical protein